MLLGVATTALVLPLVAFIALRSFDAILVRQTERELNAQGAVIAAAYQRTWAELNGKSPGNPRPRGKLEQSYTPLTSRIRDLSDLTPPTPEPLPRRDDALPVAHRDAYANLSQALEAAQLFNLSAVRVLDARGCGVASTSVVDECYAALPEVAAALRGKASSALRRRVSDEPKPAFSSLSRRGDLRVFVALPVFDDAELVGAVLLSRTAESGLEWLVKQRRDLFMALLVVLAAAVAVSFLFSRLITRPLFLMKQRLASGRGSDLRLREISAPVEIHTLGAALDERTAELHAKSRYIGEFAANVSHELKTPLTSIRGAVELLQEQGDQMDDAQRRRFLSNIEAAVTRTDRLVSRLLQLARLDTQREPDDERVRVVEWAMGMTDRYPDTVSLQLECAPDSTCSASALESIVTNLVENGLRYRRDAPVSVRVKSDSGRLHIYVSDDGPGISPDNQARLFERFFTTERDAGGTGLGLAIVQATAQNHGGGVELSSDQTGTRVHAWFDADPNATRSETHAPK